MKFKMQSYPKKGRGIMKKGYIILGIILLFALFVFIPGGVMGGTIDECLQEYSSCLSSCPIDRSADFINATDTPCHRKCEESYIECSCGDGACGLWYGEGYRENCLTCPEDCQCPEGWTCDPDDEAAVVGAIGSAWNSLAGCVYLSENDDGNGGTGDADAVCGNGSCETDKGESCANCLSDCPCSSGEACQPSDSNADARGCVIVAVPKGMALTVSTNKNAYSPEETVIVSGSVRDAKSGGPISGANVVIDINPKVSTTTDSSGNYKKDVPLPPDISQGKHTVTVTASKTGYPAVSKTTSFGVWPLKIEVERNDKGVAYEGVAADGISELRFIVEFPKEATNPQFYCESDEMGAVFEKEKWRSNSNLVVRKLQNHTKSELMLL
jgi:hypothetical protein